MIATVNPATGETLQAFSSTSEREVDERLTAATRAFMEHRRTSFAERSRLMLRAADVLESEKEKFGRLMTLEMGKPIGAAIAEAEKCALACRYYAKHAEFFLADEPADVQGGKAWVSFQPLGVVLAVMPWNFPFWQVFRFAAPALMAGNVGVLKHASNVPGCAIAIEDVFVQAGFPKGVFRTLLIGSRQVKAVIEHSLVRAVTLTGSTPAGKAVAAQAGAALKKTVLELGGSDPYIVLEDADLEYAVNTCATSRLINSGQSCVNAKRFIVVEPLVAAFTEKLVAAMKTRRMGDPLAEDTDIGPQARPDLRDELHKQVIDSVAKGARLLLGGEIPPGNGSFYPPTVLAGVKPGMPAYEEELFGPVASVFSARDEGDAVRIANDSIFGLGAAVFTSDVARGERVARELEAGCTFVNTLVASDPRLPFGGIKESGYGRELGTYGMKEFVNMKTVYIK